MTRIRRKAVFPGVILSALAGLQPGQAVSGDAQATLLPEVTVSATRIERDSFDVPAGIDSIPRSVILESHPAINLSESLGRVPGISIRNRQNFAQDLQISSRGFGARAGFGVRGLRLIADGIPATMPDGQGQAASFSLGSAERIEVLRGPFSSLYGNAAGGVIQIFTADGPAEPAITADFFAGSHGLIKRGLRYGGQHGPVNAMIDFSRFDTAGYRDHSAARREHLNAKIRLDTVEQGTLTLVVNALDQPETQDPLGLTAAQVAANPRQAVAAARAFNTRKSVAQHQGGLVYDLKVTASDRLQARAYLGERRVSQFLAIPLAAQNSPTSAGGVVDLNRSYGGGGLHWTRDTMLLDSPFSASFGFDYDRMAERRRGFLNNLGMIGDLKRDQDDTVTSTDVYAQGEWQVAPRWRLAAGARHSRVHFRSRDDFVTATNPDDSGSASYLRTTPVAGVVFSPAPALNLYANIGKGFETPTFAELAYRPGGATGLNLALRPSDSLHREIGLKALIGAAGRFNAALFRVDVKDEIVVNSSGGGRSDFRNAARTRREGIELLWGNRWGSGFESTLAWTVLDARFTEPYAGAAPAAVVPAGNRLPGVAPHSLFAEVAWRHAASGFHGGVEVIRSGNIQVNDANSEAAAAYTVWNLRAGFEQRGRRWKLRQFLRIDNVADRDHIGSVIVAEGSGRFYEPAPGRNVLLGLSAEWTL
jgi:iron complex outermembrane recepter protein